MCEKLQTAFTFQSSPGVTVEKQIMASGGAGREEERQKRKEGRKERLGSGCILSEKKNRGMCSKCL